MLSIAPDPLLTPGPAKILIQRIEDIVWIHVPSQFANESSSECSQPPNYPLVVLGAVSTLMRGRATVCGGLDFNAAGESRSCFREARPLRMQTNRH